MKRFACWSLALALFMYLPACDSSDEPTTATRGAKRDKKKVKPKKGSKAAKKAEAIAAAAAATSKVDALKVFTETAMPILAKIRVGEPQLKFEAKADKKGYLAYAAPIGWVPSTVIPGKFKPPKDSNLGFMTGYNVGTNCDGQCIAKDWKAVAEKVNFAQFRAERFEILEETALTKPEGTLIVAKAKAGGRLYISSARWSKDAPRYITCSATLETQAAALKPAFIAACSHIQGSF